MAADGKILILKLYDRILSMLLAGSRVLAVSAQQGQKTAVGDIYIGRIQNISPNIGAAFVDIGGGETVFLSLSEAGDACVVNRRLEGVLKTGDEVVVQLIKEPVRTKLAGATTSISLSGQYAVVGLGGQGSVQVSSKLNKKQQNRFRSIEALQTLSRRFRVIVRTNAGSLTEDEALVEEAEALAGTLDHLLEIADKRTCYSCLYRSKPGYVSFVENSYRSEYSEVVTDVPEVYETLQASLGYTGLPIRLYEDPRLPLHKLYSVEARIGELLDRKVWLKSGGYLVIEPTEALISIDVNTGKCETGKNTEETFYKMNREAAEMIALQLRARNLSGMILVDFINLKQKKHEAQLTEYMRQLLKQDPLPVSVVDMTGLGLMELTRKKVGPCIAEQLGKQKVRDESSCG